MIRRQWTTRLCSGMRRRYALRSFLEFRPHRLQKKTAIAHPNLDHLVSEAVHHSRSSGCDPPFLSRCALATLCSRGMTGFGGTVNGFEFFDLMDYLLAKDHTAALLADL